VGCTDGENKWRWFLVVQAANSTDLVGALRVLIIYIYIYIYAWWKLLRPE